MTPEELEIEKEAHRLAVAAETIMYEAAQRLSEAGIQPGVAVNVMALNMVIYADQLTAKQELDLFLRLEQFIADRCEILEAEGHDVSRYDDLRWQLSLEDAA